MLKNLEDIILLARNRKENPVSGSYTNQLLNDKSLSKAKILEEINELIEQKSEQKKFNATVNSPKNQKKFYFKKGKIEE